MRFYLIFALCMSLVSQGIAQSAYMGPIDPAYVTHESALVTGEFTGGGGAEVFLCVECREDGSQTYSTRSDTVGGNFAPLFILYSFDPIILNNLTPTTMYHCRIRAGLNRSLLSYIAPQDQSFTTLSAPAVPMVTSLSATNITATSADMLYGWETGNTDATITFDVGTTPLANDASFEVVQTLSGNDVLPLTDLVPATTYYVIARGFSPETGIGPSMTTSFTTAMPDVTIVMMQSTGTTATTVNGTVSVIPGTSGSSVVKIRLIDDGSPIDSSTNVVSTTTTIDFSFEGLTPNRPYSVELYAADNGVPLELISTTLATTTALAFIDMLVDIVPASTTAMVTVTAAADSVPGWPATLTYQLLSGVTVIGSGIITNALLGTEVFTFEISGLNPASGSCGYLLIITGSYTPADIGPISTTNWCFGTTNPPPPAAPPTVSIMGATANFTDISCNIQLNAVNASDLIDVDILLEGRYTGEVAHNIRGYFLDVTEGNHPVMLDGLDPGTEYLMTVTAYVDSTRTNTATKVFNTVPSASPLVSLDVIADDVTESIEIHSQVFPRGVPSTVTVEYKHNAGSWNVVASEITGDTDAWDRTYVVDVGVGIGQVRLTAENPEHGSVYGNASYTIYNIVTGIGDSYIDQADVDFFVQNRELSVIAVGDFDHGELQVYDLNGRLVAEQSVYDTTTVVSLGHMSASMYIAKVYLFFEHRIFEAEWKFVP